MSKATVDRAQRPVERLGERDVACVIGGDVCAQLEGSWHEPKRGEPCKRDVCEVLDGVLESLVAEGAREPPPPENGGCLHIDQIRCGQLSVHTKQFTGLPTGFLVVADGVGQNGGVDDDHLRERSSSRSAAA